jgi:hypothetical protein
MKDILDLFKSKDPHYLSQHHNLIDRYAAIQGGSEEYKKDTGKVFDNIYRFYMYAAFLGMRKNYRVPFSEGAVSKNFWSIKNWKPTDMVDFLFMALLEKTDTDLYALEQKTEEEVRKEVNDLKIALEEYANGGFDIISSKIKSDQYFFDSDYAFVDYLEAVSSET